MAHRAANGLPIGAKRPEGNGCHDVHYEDGSSTDGAIALDPTSATTPIVFFRFTDQSL